MIEATVELRQHVWKRNSLTAWIGAGTVFPKFSQMRSRHILPNFGLGYRWEFKKNSTCVSTMVSARADREDSSSISTRRSKGKKVKR